MSDIWTWTDRAARGERKIYHRGYLAYDRGDDGKRSAEQTLVHNTGKAAWLAYQRGLVRLVQRRIGKKEYEYMAVKI